jgi:hypothetical protein
MIKFSHLKNKIFQVTGQNNQEADPHRNQHNAAALVHGNSSLREMNHVDHPGKSSDMIKLSQGYRRDP